MGYDFTTLSPADFEDLKVRIISFDKQLWSNDFNQLGKITPARPHFSIAEYLGIGNERMIPQQALSTITNIEDIESYIKSKEKENSKSYLTVIDLPRSERVKVLTELSMMGITSGSLFPGLDGSCAELRAKFFGF